jgi:peptidoglycan/xylan/chitin deacetylase (PgdA/CDA1 family)
MGVGWTPYRLLAPGGRSGKLNIFIFHRVRPVPDALFPWDIDAAGFAALLAFLRRWFNPLPLAEAVRRLGDETLPPAAASVTFDDGYADNLAVALPLLRRHGVPATVFVACGFLDGGRMWNDTVIEAVRSSRAAQLDLRDDGLALYPVGTDEDKRAAIDALLPALKYRAGAERERLAARIATLAGGPLPDDLMLTTEQVRALHDAGVSIGAHTVTHPILTRTAAAEAEREIVESKRALEATLQAEVPLFAYPNGVPGKDYGAEHVEMARRAGFRAAVSTAKGVATARSNRFELPRFTPWGRTPMFGLRLARHLARGDSRPAEAEALAR